MSKGVNYFSITKTVVLSLFVLFFGIIYTIFINNDNYNPADLLETYIVDNENDYYQVNKYSGYGTYDIDDSVLSKSTDSNIVTIELYVNSEDKIGNEIVTETEIKENTEIITDKTDSKIESKLDAYANINLININTATIEELDTLPKIGPSIANAI